MEGTFTCGSYSLCGGGIHVVELFTCGGDIHMWELFTCGGDIHVWEAFTCGSYSRVERATKVKFFTP